MNRLSTVAHRDRRMLSFAVIALGYLVMAQALVQFLLARNVERRMDFAISGGAIGISLVLLGSVALLAESAHRNLQAEEQAVLELALRVRQKLTRSESADAGHERLPDVVVCTEYSFHRADCLLVEDAEDLVERPSAKAQAAELSACRLCLSGVT